MSLVTRCPRCSTPFRVTPAQLQQRAGKVRCGRCMHVFDGFKALAFGQGNGVSETVGLEAGNAASLETAPAAIATRASSESRAATVPNTASKPVMRSAVAAPQARSDTETRGPGGPQLWAAGSVVLLLILGLQVAFVYRSELAARSTLTKTAFSAFCDFAGCTVTLPQRPDLVKIEASDVHMLDSTRPGLIQLTATLRSYASYDLAYPALDLVLTNATEHALARRIFVPDEYLDPTRDPKRGIPSHAEITVALDLDTSGLSAAGFRLDLLPAPAP